jgi:hypothetical protein
MRKSVSSATPSKFAFIRAFGKKLLINFIFKIHLSTNSGGHFYGFVLGMTAVNLTESCGKSVPKHFKSHVYAMLALRIRHSFPRTGTMLSK